MTICPDTIGDRWAKANKAIGLSGTDSGVRWWCQVAPDVSPLTCKALRSWGRGDKMLPCNHLTSAQSHNFTQTRNIPFYIFVANKGLFFYANASKTAG